QGGLTGGLIGGLAGAVHRLDERERLPRPAHTPVNTNALSAQAASLRLPATVGATGATGEYLNAATRPWRSAPQRRPRRPFPGGSVCVAACPDGRDEARRASGRRRGARARRPRGTSSLCEG